jgi:hypothetical protein
VLADALMFDPVRPEGHAPHEPLDPALLAASTEHVAAVERARAEVAAMVDALGIG